MNKTIKMRKKRIQDRRLQVALKMPPLRRKQPNALYEVNADEVTCWIKRQPELILFMFDKLKDNGYIKYDSERGIWQGANWGDDEL